MDMNPRRSEFLAPSSWFTDACHYIHLLHTSTYYIHTHTTYILHTTYTYWSSVNRKFGEKKKEDIPLIESDVLRHFRLMEGLRFFFEPQEVHPDFDIPLIVRDFFSRFFPPINDVKTQSCIQFLN